MEDVMKEDELLEIIEHLEAVLEEVNRFSGDALDSLQDKLGENPNED